MTYIERNRNTSPNVPTIFINNERENDRLNDSRTTNKKRDDQYENTDCLIL